MPRQDVKCSLCGFIVHGKDIPYEQRKLRHKDYHAQKGINNIVGKVTWISVW